MKLKNVRQDSAFCRNQMCTAQYNSHYTPIQIEVFHRFSVRKEQNVDSIEKKNSVKQNENYDIFQLIDSCNKNVRIP